MTDPAPRSADETSRLEEWEEPQRLRVGRPAVDGATFRAVMGSFATGVAVVTARDHQGVPRGMTVTSVASVSLDPPLLLVCFATGAATRVAVTRTGVFAVNVLAAGQEAVADRFAQRRPDKFETVPTRPGRLGVPLIDGTLAVAECRVVREAPAGDHVIVFGLVAHGEADAGEPLVYHRRAYGRFAPWSPHVEAEGGRIAG